MTIRDRQYGAPTDETTAQIKSVDMVSHDYPACDLRVTEFGPDGGYAARGHRSW